MNLRLWPAVAGERNAIRFQDDTRADVGERTSLAREVANMESADSEKAALALLERENSSLRRIVVELIEKNQRLRERLISHSVQTGADSQRFAP